MAKDKNKSSAPDPLDLAGIPASEPSHDDDFSPTTEVKANGSSDAGPGATTDAQQKAPEPVLPAPQLVGGQTPQGQAGEFTVVRAITLSWGDQMIRLAPGDKISDGTHGPGVVTKMRSLGVAFEEDLINPADVPTVSTAPRVVPAEEAAKLHVTGDVGPAAALPAALTGAQQPGVTASNSPKSSN